MRRRARRAVKVLAVAGVVLVGLGAADQLLAGAAVTDPVGYQVGQVVVAASRMRNASCSVTRNFRNDGPTAIRVVAMIGDRPPNSGQFDHDGDMVLQPGEQVTGVWTNHGYVDPGAVELDVAVSPGGEFAHVELIEACFVVGGPSDVPAVPPVEVTAPVPSTVPAPQPTVPVVVAGPVEPPTVPPVVVVPGPADPTFGLAATGVEASSLSAARQLPATGASDWLGVLALVGAALLLSGGTLFLAFRKGGGR